MTATTFAIEVEGLRKNYGRVVAVDRVDLTVPAGSVFGLIGPNGAGKTTLVKILLGVAWPTGGQVRVLGSRPADPVVRRRIGYLPERLQLPAALTAVAFLRSVGRLKGLARRALDDQVPRLLTLVGLEERAWARRTGTFSKGMVQRTGLAAALIGEPELLVLDEPTDGIDPLGRAHMRELLRAAGQRGATIFLNSHLLNETERLCDHVAILDRGRLRLSGPLDVVRAERAFRVRFATASDLDQRALDCGFDVDEEARGRGLSESFSFAGSEAADLSAALQRALAAGLVVREVLPKLKDLETVLEESVGAGDAP
ncbi:MAG: ABC transporter ATP-binding protein [Deltaproteobacteria bacterium]|nr:ABC transporter ATP-binding protein [Deltaproteobacteria bacterium]